MANKLNNMTSTNNNVESDDTVTILLCGVGGQGTILAADLLARVALLENFDIKVSEIHGMSQRGGAVTTVVRFGSCVRSMVADYHCADFVVSFEKLEALRSKDYLKSKTDSENQGILLVNDEIIEPQSVLTKQCSLPHNMDEQLASLGAIVLPAYDLAKRAGTIKSSNVVLLGALSKYLPFSGDTWLEVIKKRVPQKYLEENIEAFNLGRAFVE